MENKSSLNDFLEQELILTQNDANLQYMTDRIKDALAMSAFMIIGVALFYSGYIGKDDIFKYIIMTAGSIFFILGIILLSIAVSKLLFLSKNIMHLFFEKKIEHRNISRRYVLIFNTIFFIFAISVFYGFLQNFELLLEQIKR